MEESGSDDAARIGRHLAGAGEPARASSYLARAAEAAAAALACDEAARLYKQALELHPDGDVALSLACADALTAAGHGPEAAALLLQQVPRVDEARALELRRRAAENLLLSGRLDEGYAVMGELLSALGLSAPRSDAGAVARVLFGRARQLLAGKQLQARAASPDELLRVDTIGGLTWAVWMMDPLMGAALQTEHLRLALRSGDRARAALALSMESMVSAVQGFSAQARTRAILDRARELGAGLPEVLPTLQLSQGGVAILEGRWLEANQVAAETGKLALAGVPGHGSLHASLLQVYITSQFWLGRPGDAGRELPSLLRLMEERGQMVGWMWAKLLQGWALSCSGRIDEARATSAAVRERLPARGFTLQRWWMGFADSMYPLFERDGEGAWARVEENGGGGLAVALMGQLPRATGRWVRGNAALARALQSPAQRAPMLREARRQARKLAREGAPWTAAIARALCASIASIAGDDAGALAHLEAAEPLLEAHHFESILAAVRIARGRLISGDAGAALVARAESWMAAQGAVPAANWAQLPWRD